MCQLIYLYSYRQVLSKISKRVIRFAQLINFKSLAKTSSIECPLKLTHLPYCFSYLGPAQSNLCGPDAVQLYQSCLLGVCVLITIANPCAAMRSILSLELISICLSEFSDCCSASVVSSAIFLVAILRYSDSGISQRTVHIRSKLCSLSMLLFMMMVEIGALYYILCWVRYVMQTKKCTQFIYSINNEYKSNLLTKMQSELSHRSYANSSKYVTPRKSTIKKKRAQLEQLNNTNMNSNNNPDYNASLSCSAQSRNWKITDFDVIKQMGRGKFGYVYAAREKMSDYVVAIKKMNKKELKENDFEQQVKREIIIQASLSHPNILRLLGYFWDFENVYLILEYAPQGELFHILQKHKKLTEMQVSLIIAQVCEGLQYLHSNMIIHRDIKPENILVSGQNVKIGDFGWSIKSATRRETLCGTLDYLAPEIVQGLTHDNSIDVWQVGVLAYELAVGHPPFETPTSQQTYQKIVSDEVSFPAHVSWDLRHMINRILHKNPNKRPHCSQILQQPFILKYKGHALDLSFNQTQ